MKKILAYVIVALIGLQIPLIVSMSVAGKIQVKLESVQSMTDKAKTPMKAVGGLFSKVTDVVPGVNQLGISDMLEGGEGGLDAAIEILKHMSTMMYFCIFFVLFLLALLFFVLKRMFFQNAGAAYLLGGILCLINAILIYYFFVINFDATFQLMYGQTTMSAKTSFVPFMPSLAKLFTKKFIMQIIDSILIRNMIGVLVCLPLGVLLIALREKLSRKIVG